MKKRAFIIIAMLFNASIATASQVAVMPVKATNITEGEAEAIGVLISNAYAQEAQVDVVGPKDTAPVLARAGKADAAAATLGVEQYIEIEAVQLVSKIQVGAVLRSADGVKIHAANMTGRSLDDMEQVAKRLAAALVNRRSPEETRNLNTVTANEGKIPNRVFVDKVKGLKTGFAMPVASEIKLDPLVSFQYDSRLEGESYFLEYGVGFFLPADLEDRHGYGGVFAEFGASYYILNESVSPYVGAGVVPRIAAGLDSGGVMIAGYGQVGVMFFRESSSRFYVELRVTQNAIPFKRDNGRNVYPTEFGLNIGIGW